MNDNLQNQNANNERRVLIIDDDIDFADSIASILEPRGYSLAVANNAKEAIKIIKEFDASVALIDINLEGESGINLIPKLKSERPGILCIMVTAFSEVESAIKALYKGAYEYLRKPVNGDELIAIMDISFEKLKLEQDKIRAEEVLAVEKAFFEELFKSALEAIVMVDNDSHVLRVNDEFTKIFGYSSNEAIGKSIDKLIASKEYKKEALSINKRILSGERVSLETVRKRKDGTLINVSIIGFPIKVNGKQRAFFGIYRDITASKRAEKMLKESEQRYRSIVENSHAGILIVGEDYRFKYLNNKLCKILGYSYNEIIGQDFRKFLDEESKILVADHYIRRQKGESIPPCYEFNVVRKSGEKRRVEISSTIIKDSDGRLNTISQILDITDRKSAEEALRNSEEKYRLLVENANDSICIVQDNLIKFHNKNTEVLSGYSSEKLSNLQFGNFIYPEDREMLIERYKKRMRVENIPRLHNFRVLSKDGKIQWTQMNAVKIKWNDRPAILCFIRDITNEKKLEAQLQQAQKMEAVGTLAGGVAHDFNNLLQAILGYSDLLLMSKKEGEKDWHELQQIKKAGLRAKELTSQLLTFSRKAESKPKPLDLNHEVEEVVKLLERTIPKMIEIELNLSHSLNVIMGDSFQLGQVLMNLAVNARDAMPDGGKLIIETNNIDLDEKYSRFHLGVNPGKYVLLSMSDTGHGMDGETIGHIFEPFYTTKQVGRGTGLGLAMVYGIVKKHGGYITCYSEPNQGTTFKLYFPAVEENALLEEIEKKHELIRGSESILLVDDEDYIRELGENILLEFGYKVIMVKSGEEALAIYSKRHDAIDLVILDLIMPGMGGKRCLKELFRIDSKVKVIVASGYSANGSVSDMIKSGAKGFISKPYSVYKMLKVVRDVLDRD